jgi:hypothetical protein
MAKWQMATLEHVEALFHGGADRLRNLVMACGGCNSSRGSMFEAEEFYELMQRGDTFEERRRELVRARDRRKHQRAMERQANQNVFVIRMAQLFMVVPGLYEVLVGAIEEDRQRYARLREENRLAQQRAA